jgi:hypothetical protein
LQSFEKPEELQWHHPCHGVQSKLCQWFITPISLSLWLSWLEGLGVISTRVLSTMTWWICVNIRRTGVIANCGRDNRCHCNLR